MVSSSLLILRDTLAACPPEKKCIHVYMYYRFIFTYRYILHDTLVACSPEEKCIYVYMCIYIYFHVYTYWHISMYILTNTSSVSLWKDIYIYIHYFATRRCHTFAKEPNITAKQPYITAKEPRIPANEYIATSKASMPLIDATLLQKRPTKIGLFSKTSLQT